MQSRAECFTTFLQPGESQQRKVTHAPRQRRLPVCVCDRCLIWPNLLFACGWPLRCIILKMPRTVCTKRQLIASAPNGPDRCPIRCGELFPAIKRILTLQKREMIIFAPLFAGEEVDCSKLHHFASLSAHRAVTPPLIFISTTSRNFQTIFCIFPDCYLIKLFAYIAIWIFGFGCCEAK